ncbi:MAG: TerD family protein [Alkaliphilus sp.]|nr:TerD family protein [Alkaliphilus sp.]
MEKVMIKGEKIVISRMNDPSQQFVFELSYPRINKYLYDIDPFTFMMDEKGKILEDEIIFYNNPFNDNDAVNYKEVYKSEKVYKSFEININKMPKEVQAISLVMSVYCKNRNKDNKPLFVEFDLEVINKTQRSTLFSSVDNFDVMRYKTFVLGEIYKYRNSWKYNAVKQEMDDELMKVLRKMYQIKIFK